MNKKEILKRLEAVPVCKIRKTLDYRNCKQCICGGLPLYYENEHYTNCCRKFLHIAENCLERKEFKKLLSFLRKKYNGRFPDEQTDAKWFIPFFGNNNKLELE